MNGNDLIDRYVHAVGAELPRNMRQDIEQELRSLIQDALDEQIEIEEKPSAETIAAILKQFGKPSEMAANYRPKQALIGEILFPTYRNVITIVLSVVGGLHLVLLLILFFASKLTASGTINVLKSFVNTGFTVAALVTLIFAVLERIDNVKEEISAENNADWNPLQLPKIAQTDRINRAEMIVSIVFSVIFIIAFNFFFEQIGFVDLAGEEWGIVTFFAPEFERHVVWLTASWALGALLKLIVLSQGRWTRPTRWLEIAEQTFGLFVLYRIFTSPVIAILAIFTTATKAILAIVMVVILIDTIVKLYRLLSTRQAPIAVTMQSHA